MRTRLAIAVVAALAFVPATARGADLGEGYGRPPYGALPTTGYEALWAGRHASPARAPVRPHRRVMDGPDYVGSNWGLGKPPVSGIGPRPDWGRSTYD